MMFVIRNASKVVVRVLIFLSSTLLMVSVKAQVITTNSTGEHGDFFYSLWKDTGDVVLELHEGGRYTAEWQPHTGNWVGGLGWNPGGPKVVNYFGNYSPDENSNSYLTLYGWTTDPLIEYYIVESYGTYNPSSDQSSIYYGTYESDGATYDAYRWRSLSLASLESPTPSPYRYTSIRRNKKDFGPISGTITTGNHFEAWAKVGLELGSHDYMILATEGYQSRGHSDITVSEGVQDCGSSNNMAVCCNISADNDRDGYGEQPSGDMCVVTEDTIGWHPPNPSNVLAAINAGGLGKSIAIGNIWYEPNSFISGGTSFAAKHEVADDEGSEVYRTVSTGDISVEVPINESQYVSVELGFIELGTPGFVFLDKTPEKALTRIFDVSIEGEVVYKDMNIYKEVGVLAHWKRDPIEVLVTDGILNIEISSVNGNGVLSSILVKEARGGGDSNTSSSNSNSSSGSQQTSSSSGGSLGYIFLTLLGGLFCLRKPKQDVSIRG